MLSNLKKGVAVMNRGYSTYQKVLTLETINETVKKAEYAVRGELAIKAEKYRVDLEGSNHNLPFDKVIHCNIGNPQQLKQKPITFFRQVCSLVEYPDLLNQEKRSVVKTLYPQDAIDRAEKIISAIGSNGSYTHSKGIPFIRKHVAEFIERRDGFKSDPESIFLTSGASDGIKSCLNLLISNPNVGVMIPVPQYPLYSATMTMLNGKAVPYYLNEESDWGFSMDYLKDSLHQARNQGVDVRGFVVINPGNPTGQCASEDNLKDLVRFCRDERLVLFSDEVYQTNIYQPEKYPFHSLKKVLKTMGSDYEDVELFSFHSVSKGMLGECGKRGGYFEATGIEQPVLDQLYKAASVSLCSNVTGQLIVDLMVKPPVVGDESYELYNKEMTEIYESLKRRATILVEAFNKMEGVTCNPSQGSMYSFPRVRFPDQVIQAAQKAGKSVDAYYCLAMLDATGVCVVPGSGFGQKEGTYHFRSTFLPPESDFDSFIKRIVDFHNDFLARHSKL